MRIAIDGRELQGKPTGVGRFLGQLLSAWNAMPGAQCHQFILLAPGGADRGTLWEQLDLPGLVRQAHADVLFSPGYTGPLRPPVPMVVAIHDVSFAAHPEWFSWREGARRRTITRLAARAADRVVTISQFSKREIVAHLDIDAERIRVIYPGVTAVANHNSSHRSARVLYVGSIFNRRHVPELIQAFAQLAGDHPEVHLDIVGDNRTSPHVNVESIVRETGLAGRIHLRSYVTEEELRDLYSHASAFVFLSEYEGFGLTPLEALASGLPVVLLDTPVAREVCGDAALYVPRPQPALIARALQTLLFDAQQRALLLDAALRVRARYSWTDCARRVLEVLVEAGSRRRAGSTAP